MTFMGKIVWLASYPKSGNTWMRAFLCNLVANPTRPISINELGRFSPHAADADFYSQFSDKSAEELTYDDLAIIRPRVHREIANLRPGRVFVKTHSFLGESCDISTITPDVTAAAIYIVRNPLDVCLSFSRHTGLTIDDSIERIAKENTAGIEMLGTQVLEPIRSWSINVQSWTAVDQPNLLVVRYEDMLDRTFETFQKVAKFLGLGALESTIRTAIQFSSLEELQRQEYAQGFKEASGHSSKFFGSGQDGKSESLLTKQQIERLVSDHRQQMECFDYIPNRI
jgi:hypothetical protein